MHDEKIVKSIREQIADHLRSDIFRGELAEGDQLREEPLAKRFGVSRGPIRDVLLQLTQEGLLVSKPNSGVKVGSPPDPGIQPLIVDLRQRIELFALEQIVPHISDQQIQRLNHLVALLRDACERQDLADMAKHDMAFHRFIVGLVDGKDLVALWLPIVARMMLHYTRHKDMMEAHREHAAIVEAIRKRDLEAAKKALLHNIQ